MSLQQSVALTSAPDGTTPVMAEAKAQTHARLVVAARDMIPVLKERAARTEEQRTVSVETIRDFKSAGFFRIFQPARYGGYELDYGAIQFDLAGEIGRACGSSAWVLTVLACHSWMMGMLPREAQDEVWADDPEALLCSGVVPDQGRAVPAPGGVSVSGRWRFSSGVDHAQWALLGMPLIEGSGPPQMIWCLLPRKDFTIADEWFVSGLRGTGSKDILVKDVLVPERRITTFGALMAGQGPGGKANESHIYRLPLFSVFPYNICAPAYGLARGAIETYAQQVKARPPRQMGPPQPGLDPLLLRFAEASSQVDAAAALLYKNAGELNEQARAGQPFLPAQAARYQRDLSFAALQFTHAAESIAYMSGAHGLFDSNPIQRILRDIHAVNVHIGLRWESCAANYVRAALEIAPAH
jgi:alkylation response protein AidB-like acyl-CoA dehydrogenase